MAASVALVDAGIEMLDTVTAAHLVYTDQSDQSHSQICLDPSESELEHSEVTGSMSIAYLPSMNEVSSIVSDGMHDPPVFRRNMDACLEACIRMHAAVRQSLVT